MDPAALAQDEIELMLQVNGKLRGSVLVPPVRTRPRSSGWLASAAFTQAAAAPG